MLILSALPIFQKKEARVSIFDITHEWLLRVFITESIIENILRQNWLVL